jgi:hypothetical protein
MGLENFDDDDEGGGDTVRMNKPAKMRSKLFEKTKEKEKNVT